VAEAAVASAPLPPACRKSPPPAPRLSGGGGKDRSIPTSNGRRTQCTARPAAVLAVLRPLRYLSARMDHTRRCPLRWPHARRRAGYVRRSKSGRGHGQAHAGTFSRARTCADWATRTHTRARTRIRTHARTRTLARACAYVHMHTPFIANSRSHTPPIPKHTLAHAPVDDLLGGRLARADLQPAHRARSLRIRVRARQRLQARDLPPR
jgi:hypothetical protein